MWIMRVKTTKPKKPGPMRVSIAPYYARVLKMMAVKRGCSIPYMLETIIDYYHGKYGND